MPGLIDNAHPTGSLSRLSRHALRLAAVTALLLPFAESAWSVGIGPLRWITPAGQPPHVEIELTDTATLDLGNLRGRLAARESYDVAGLIYDPRLANVQITTQRAPDGRVSLRLDKLPADAPSLDLLVTVNDRVSLSLAEFHVDVRNGPFQVPPSPPGTRLSTPKAAPRAVVTAQAQTQGAAQAPAGSAAAVKQTAQAVPASAAAVAAAKPAAPIAAAQGATSPAADIAAARAALDAWARAWSERDVDAYVAAYTPDYAGRGDMPSRKAWVAQRRQRITAKRSISVEISGVLMTQHPQQVVAEFRQRYRADGIDEQVRKSMVLVPVDGRWLIAQETEQR